MGKKQLFSPFGKEEGEVWLFWNRCARMEEVSNLLLYESHFSLYAAAVEVCFWTSILIIKVRDRKQLFQRVYSAIVSTVVQLFHPKVYLYSVWQMTWASTVWYPKPMWPCGHDAKPGWVLPERQHIVVNVVALILHMFGAQAEQAFLLGWWAKSACMCSWYRRRVRLCDRGLPCRRQSCGR